MASDVRSSKVNPAATNEGQGRELGRGGMGPSPLCYNPRP